MTIQINTDNNIKGDEHLAEYCRNTVATVLSRFSEQVTRVEVHLNDENSHKEGPNDKRCLVEARLEGMNPIAVTNTAANNEQALKGALNKMKSSLDSAIGKLRNF
jgi:ribosome-associated translation inhibitor RaiA